jgi:hypothetical protein
MAKTDQEKIEAYNKMIEGATRGGKSLKHFSPESKERQRSGAQKGGHNGLGKHKNFKPETLKRFSENGKSVCEKRWHGSCNSTLKGVQ